MNQFSSQKRKEHFICSFVVNSVFHKEQVLQLLHDHIARL